MFLNLSKLQRTHASVIGLLLIFVIHNDHNVASETPAPGEHRATVNDVTLWYKVSGKGPILIVQAPGWGIGSEYLQRTLKALEQNFTVIYYDTRGSGHSSRPKDETRMSTIDMADDLEAFRKWLGLSTVAVLGHSHGGQIAAAFASKYPQHVKRLILVDAVPPKNPDPENATKWRELDERLAKDPRVSEATAAERELDTPKTPEEMAKLLQRMAPLYWHDTQKASVLANLPPIATWAGAALEKADKRNPFDLLSGLKQLDAPTLIVVGKEDEVVPVFMQDEFQQNIPRARFVIFERSGHFPWIEEPDKFFDLVTGFLRD